jgi:hypothetical protein
VRQLWGIMIICWLLAWDMLMLNREVKFEIRFDHFIWRHHRFGDLL